MWVDDCRFAHPFQSRVRSWVIKKTQFLEAEKHFLPAAFAWRDLFRAKGWWGHSVKADEAQGSFLSADDSAWAKAFFH